jgi:hypothetical protein
MMTTTMMMIRVVQHHPLLAPAPTNGMTSGRPPSPPPELPLRLLELPEPLLRLLELPEPLLRLPPELPELLVWPPPARASAIAGTSSEARSTSSRTMAATRAKRE